MTDKLATEQFCADLGKKGTSTTKLVIKQDLGKFGCKLKSGSYSDNQCVAEKDISESKRHIKFYPTFRINTVTKGYDLTIFPMGGTPTSDVEMTYWVNTDMGGVFEGRETYLANKSTGLNIGFVNGSNNGPQPKVINYSITDLNPTEDSNFYYDSSKESMP